MLSVLIPVYNYSVRSLVEGLQAQIRSLNVPVQILIGDDHSVDEFENAQLPGIGYVRHPRNFGRAKNRNLLAERARHPFLLFLDADATVVRPDFLQTYITALKAGKVVCGGLTYADRPPADRELHLRWHYGRQREMRSVGARSLRPYASFSSFNFGICRDVFCTLRFDETITEYGHEDTLFGRELQRRGIPVHHLDNPLRHDGLEPAGVFLDKTAVAVRGLLRLNQDAVRLPTKLWRTYAALRRNRLDGWVRRFGPAPVRWRRFLLDHPRQIWAMDLYKLKLLLHTSPTNHQQ